MTGYELHALLVGREQSESRHEQWSQVDVPAGHARDDADLVGLLDGGRTCAGEHGDQLEQLPRGDVLGQRLDDELEGALATGWSPR